MDDGVKSGLVENKEITEYVSWAQERDVCVQVCRMFGRMEHKEVIEHKSWSQERDDCVQDYRVSEVQEMGPDEESGVAGTVRSPYPCQYGCHK